MTSATLLFLVLILLSVPDVKSSESLFKLKCQPAVGVIGQTTHISCSIEFYTKPKPVVINTVALTRSGEKKSCFAIRPFENKRIGDSRFEVEKEPSLQLHNTAISDEGEYRYYIRTNLGQEQVRFTINVTAKYSNPIITSVQKEIVNDGAADLYCSASGGYPAGTIHWFDQSNTNWTKSATLQSTQGNDGLFSLSSKLSFQKIDSLWAPFRCVVLNNRYEEEGGTTSTLEIKDNWDNPPSSSSTVNNGIAGVVVIGSLIVGLLIVLLFKRRRNQHIPPTSDGTVKNNIAPCVVFIGSVIVGVLTALLFKRRRDQQLKRAKCMEIFGKFSKEPADVQEIKELKRAKSVEIIVNFSKEPADVQETKGLNEPVYKKAADTEENIAV